MSISPPDIDRRHRHWVIPTFLISLTAFFTACSDSAATAPGGGGGRGGGAPAPVLVDKVHRKVVPLALNAIGAVEPIQTASVRSQVTGVLQKLNFKEGQEVKQGDLLFEIDSRSFQNALRQAEADLEKARVQHDSAVTEVGRYQTLNAQNMVSKEQYQAIQDNERSLRAAMGAAEAAVANDRLQLEFCSIRAPITGRTGSVGAHEGDLVRASDANVALVVINQVSPIYVTFAVPQQNLADIVRYQSAGSTLVTAAAPGQDAVTETGELVFYDNLIDPTTGTLKLKAAFPNDDRRLWPGQFTNIRLTLASPEELVVPAQAVQNDQKGQHVIVVKADQTAELRVVTIERTVDTDAVVASGLQDGETVVVDGHLRVIPGRPVAVRDPANPTAAPARAGGARGKGEKGEKGKSS